MHYIEHPLTKHGFGGPWRFNSILNRWEWWDENLSHWSKSMYEAKDIEGTSNIVSYEDTWCDPIQEDY